MDAQELSLRIVPLDSVILHEQVEHERVEKLKRRLEQDRVLKNPPIVSRTIGHDGEPRYIVLDGATRTTALREIICCDIIVQIVDYHSPTLRLEAWNHMLLNAPRERLLDDVSGIPGLSLTTTSEEAASAALERREIIGYFLLADGSARALSGGSDFRVQADLLNRVVETYDRKYQMYRVAHTDVERLAAEHQQLTAIMVFPRFTPGEIEKLAISGAKLPMGVTRHIIPGRALRINIPLDILESDDSLDEKNVWVDDWLKRKIRDRHVRFYQEPVFLFDE